MRPLDEDLDVGLDADDEGDGEKDPGEGEDLNIDNNNNNNNSNFILVLVYNFHSLRCLSVLTRNGTSIRQCCLFPIGISVPIMSYISTIHFRIGSVKFWFHYLMTTQKREITQ